MKKLLAGIFAILVCAAFCAQDVAAAQRKAPPLKDMGGQEVSTEYFRLTIPAGWSMPVPVKKMANNGMTVVFGSMAQDPAVSISVMKTPMSAKEIGEATIANMKKSGLQVGALEEKDGLWHAAISGKGSGAVWFGSSDGTAAVTIVTGKNVEKANELLSAIEPKIKGLFPKQAN